MLDGEHQVITMDVAVFQGHTGVPERFTRFMDRRLKPFLRGAYVHGSYAVNEDISYSDFDGLVIIRKDVLTTFFSRYRLARRLRKSERLMRLMDPLQHHGWFMVTENDLDDWPQTYFPHELFAYSRSIFSDRGRELRVRIDCNPDYLTAFNTLTNSVLRKIRNKKYPENMFALKGLLSQFMLVPTLYLQARDNKPLFKKFSFAAARKDFSPEEWGIMDEVSLIRERWHFSVHFFQRFMLSMNHPFLNRLKKIIPLKIPADIKSHLSEDFYLRMKMLVEAMQKKLK